MKGHKIIYYILGAFIAGTFLLIYIQFNSSKNIGNLISANGKLLGEFKVSTDLYKLEKDIVTVESKIRGIVSTQDSEYIQGLEININEVKDNLSHLQKISDDDSSGLYIDDLSTLVQRKIIFNQQILDSLHISGKASAEKLLGTKYGKKLTDSIFLFVNRIDSIRKKHLRNATTSIDKSGQEAQRFNTILIVLVLLSAAILFWYIINIIKKQLSLIEQLNISEKKVKEAAELKEKFMANMSHEIRTPMNAILGFTNLLLRKNIDAESKEYIQTIQKSGENLLTIINDILDLSKIEAGMMRIESAPFSIRGLVHSVETMFKSKTTEKQLQLTAYVDESLPDTLEGDATRLTQVLVNLIGNAIKFTNSGSITIKITNEGIAEQTVNTGITITDTGIGIEKDKLQTIFERFQQAEDAVTRKYGGTGLGLSIVNDLVLLQHGTIKVESEPGKGTCFKITIPYHIAVTDVEKIPSAEYDSTSLPKFENICILVAEDNEINQSLIRHLFKEWGLSFDLATNGREALERLHSKNYSLILMDIQMPEMDGYTATQEVRKRLKCDTPIIAMTAHALAGEREKCLSYGMNEYISKPIREDHLHKLIKHFTQFEAPATSRQATTIPEGQYAYINLQYMKEISGGNREYEKTVTEQFIESIPEDLLAIEKAWQDNNIRDVKQLAHNLKTTVSVMGLNEILQPSLDAIEYEELTRESFTAYFQQVKSICNASLEEAKQFYATF
ncbi:MAG: ATP-binding protein [Bacteroidetes bacterium]|nr:ATP-binding protein [Bacteroidota bacterium]